MDAAEAFHEHLESKRAALTPNQLKKQRKKRAKLFKQAAESTLGPNPASTHQADMDTEREGSVALPDSGYNMSESALTIQPASSGQVTASNASEAGHAAGAAATNSTEVIQQPGSKKRKGVFAQPLKPLRPRHSSQTDARRQGGDLSSVMKALQHQVFSVSGDCQQQDCKQQEVLSPPKAAAGTAAEHCSEASVGVSTCTQPDLVAPTDSSISKGPCRMDLSGQLAVITQQLSSDHSSSTGCAQPSSSQGSQQLQDAAERPQQQQAQDCQQQLSRKKQRPSCLYGNYHHYYGYRIGPSGFEDPRMKVLDPEWFRGADVLDVGCNEGLLTLALAVGCGCRSMLGVDIDPGLVAKACTNLSRSRTQLTQQFREAVASRDANAGRWVASPVPSAAEQAAGAASSEGPLSIIAASTAALAGSSSHSSSTSSNKGNTRGNAIGSSIRDQVGSRQRQQEEEQQQQQQQQSHRQYPQQAPPQQRQQQHHSLQGRVVQLDRQLKSLSRVSFRCGNWLEMGCAANKYGVITCFSVTKWIHLNWGDDGIMKLFHKFFRCLIPGGVLVLEPQPFKSYQNAVHKAGVQEAPFKKISQLKLRPEGFCDFLTQRVGFELVQQLNTVSQVAGEEAVPVKGFDRPVVVLRKPVQQ